MCLDPNERYVQPDLSLTKDIQVVGLSSVPQVFRCSLVCRHIALKRLRGIFTESAYMAISQRQHTRRTPLILNCIRADDADQNNDERELRYHKHNGHY